MALDLTIVTPAGTAYQGDVDEVVLPGSEGDFGVRPGHERLLSALRCGEVQIDKGGQTTHAAIAGGFAQVTGEQVTVLADSCELANEIDTGRAERAVQQCEQDLAGLDRSDESEAIRIAEFEAALERARNRLAVSQRK